MKKDVFMFICQTNKTQAHINPIQGVINNNFVCDIKTNIIRETKFSFENKQDILIDVTNLGPTSMFRTVDFRDGRPC